MTAELIGQFADLFDGNHEAIGLEQGGCMHLHSGKDTVWKDCIRDHLAIGGDASYGVYPMVPDASLVPTWMVKWGCVDFDVGEDESWIHAKNVWLALTTFGITGWIERSRSKGYHVWVFADEWTEAPLMRYALLAACQMVDAPTTEINPKQTHLGQDQLGNYVRLPYPGHLGDPRRAIDLSRRVVMVPEGNKLIHLPEFVSEAYDSRTGVEPLRTLAGLYVAPEAPIRRRDWETRPTESLEAAIARLSGKARIIFEQGPLEGSGRGHTLYKLARYLREDDRHTVEEATAILRDADSRWGKFYARNDGDKRIMELVERAWFNPT